MILLGFTAVILLVGVSIEKAGEGNKVGKCEFPNMLQSRHYEPFSPMPRILVPIFVFTFHLVHDCTLLTPWDCRLNHFRSLFPPELCIQPKKLRGSSFSAIYSLSIVPERSAQKGRSQDPNYLPIFALFCVHTCGNSLSAPIRKFPRTCAIFRTRARGAPKRKS